MSYSRVFSTYVLKRFKHTALYLVSLKHYRHSLLNKSNLVWQPEWGVACKIEPHKMHHEEVGEHNDDAARIAASGKPEGVGKVRRRHELQRNKVERQSVKRRGEPRSEVGQEHRERNEARETPEAALSGREGEEAPEIEEDECGEGVHGKANEGALRGGELLIDVDVHKTGDIVGE